MEIAVWLGWKTGVNGGVFAAFEVFVNNGANKMVIRKLVFVHHGLIVETKGLLYPIFSLTSCSVLVADRLGLNLFAQGKAHAKGAALP